MSDRNKTELTQNITRLSALWLDGKGFKPVETEVGVERGWIADVAGVCCPTQTELIELRLLKRSPRWVLDREDNEAKMADWRAQYDLIPGRLTALIEVKTSVGDYRGDRKWTSGWPTNLCYVAMPEGMIPQAQWPFGWGVILFSQEGTTIRKVHPPKVVTVPAEKQLDVILSLAVARDHVTRHARLRELQKKIRLKDADRNTVSRVQSAISFVLKVRAGMPVEEALRHCGIQAKIPTWILDELKQLAAPAITK